ncbi:hypothetical protein RhiirB3_451529 [Rhizophagus irregularis]|nr:hypothetical protein RhiirB3_451529 [Rhizophagus irregularis]
MSKNRKVCQNCRSKVIVTPTPLPQNVFKDFSKVKQVTNKQFKMSKEQEKYKKRFKNSLKSNKNKWQITNNGIESKVLISKYKLKRKGDILKKQYISEKEMEFLVCDKNFCRNSTNKKDEVLIYRHTYYEECFQRLHLEEIQIKSDIKKEMNKDSCKFEETNSYKSKVKTDFELQKESWTSNYYKFEVGYHINNNISHLLETSQYATILENPTRFDAKVSDDNTFQKSTS